MQRVLTYVAGILITSDRDVSVFGKAFGSTSGDAFHVEPLTPNSTQFIFGSYKVSRSWPDACATVVAYENSTEVTMYHPDTSLIFSATLNAGETYTMRTDQWDYTGSKIESSKPIAVFAGNECADIDVYSCDPLYEGIPPLANLGLSYVIPPIPGRGATARYVYKVMASDDKCSVETFENGQWTNRANLSRGEVFDYISCNTEM